MTFFNRTALCALAAVAAMSQAATAQIRPPSTTQPGQIQERLRVEPERPEVGGETLITIPDSKGRQRKMKDGVTFTLRDIEFQNLSAFSQKDIMPDYGQYLGKSVSISTLNEIAGAITVRYRNAGYILSRAVVPPQNIDNGVAKIRIIEGYVHHVLLEGKHVDPYLLSAYAQKIRDARPLDAKTLERYLLLMEDLPGVTARAVIRPAPDAPGASDIVVTIDEKHIDGSVTLDNRGTRFMGPVQGGLTVDANDLFGIYDRTQFHGVETAELNQLRYGQFSHEEQLDSEGTKIILSGGYTKTHPTYTLQSADLEGTDTLLSAQLSHPFIRSRQSNLFGTIEFDLHDTKINALGDRLYNDRLRILRAGGSYDFVDTLAGVNRFEGQLSQGLNWDASEADSHSRASGRTDFFKGTAQISRLQPIKGPFDFFITTAGQLSANSLLTAEQFALGGESYNSAYDPSELLGDSGIAARAEIRYNRGSDIPFLLNYQLYGFYDIGKVWNRDSLAGESASASLADTGFGLRFNAERPLSGQVEFAAPLTRGVSADGNTPYRPRVFFSLAYRF